MEREKLEKLRRKADKDKAEAAAAAAKGDKKVLTDMLLATSILPCHQRISPWVLESVLIVCVCSCLVDDCRRVRRRRIQPDRHVRSMLM